MLELKKLTHKNRICKLINPNKIIVLKFKNQKQSLEATND